MKVSIVAAYNQEIEMTKNFLDNMQEHTKYYEDEIEMILVNGGNKIRIEHPFITKRIDLEKNNGFCHTLNQGLKAVSDDSDYVLFTGNDSFPVTHTWLKDLMRIHLISGAMMTCPANDRPGMTRLKHLLKVEQDEYWETHFFPSIVWLMKKEDVDKVGLLDENYVRTGMYADNDYCMRIKRLGGKIVVSKNVLLKHLLSGEGKRIGTQDADMRINLSYMKKKWKL